MFIRLLTRSGLLSCFSTAAWFSIAVEVPEAPLNNNKKFNTSGQVAPSDLKSVADVEIFEKLKGCKFIFLERGQKKGHGGTEFVEKKLKEAKGAYKTHWEGQVFANADYIKNHSCKNGKIVAFWERWPNKWSLKKDY